MKVTIDKTFQVGASLENAWTLLSDPTKVVGCVPGARITETVDAQNYKGTVSLKVGPVVTNFKGNVLIETLDAETHNMVLKGDGMDVKGKGSASMTMRGQLQAISDGGTEVAISMEVSVIGRLAQFGSRLMEDVSNRMFDQFVTCFQQKLQVAAPSTSMPSAASPSEAAESAAGPATSSSADNSSEDADAAEPQPIEALPLLFSVLGSAISRFFRGLFGRQTDK